MKDAARRAIDAIQSRTPGAGSGQLSVSEPAEHGALSQAEEKGALSITKKNGES